MMSADRIQRTQEALKETKRLLEKELSYQPKFHQQALIEDYKKHIAKLEGMLLEADCRGNIR